MTNSTYSHTFKRIAGLFLLACTAIAAVTQSARADDYYLRGLGSPNIFDAVPVATLSSAAPFSPFLLNFDPLRDSDPGLTIARGGSNINETDPTLHQTWFLPNGELELDGPASLTVWLAMKGFDSSGLKGHIDFHLVECDPDGNNCVNIKKEHINNHTAWTGGWDRFDLDFGHVVATVSPGKVFAVKAFVKNGSDDDMMVAYGATPYQSKVSVTPANSANDVNLTIVKSASRSWGYVGTSIVYTLQYNCVSTIAAGENVTITDVLDPWLTVNSLTNSSHIASSNYDSGTNTVTFTFVDPLPAGSTGEVKINAEFTAGVPDNYVAPNSAAMTADNGANQTSNNVNVTAYNSTSSGPTYSKGVRVEKSSSSSDIELPYDNVYYDIEHGNTGNVGEDVENYLIVDVFPVELKLDRFNVGEFPGTTGTVNVSYMLLGSSSWIPWPGGPWNTDNDDDYVYASALGLPSTTYVVGLRFDFGTLPGGAGFHPDGSGVEDIDIDLNLVDPATMVVGDTVTNCADLTADDTPAAGTDSYVEQSCVGVEVEEPSADYHLWDWDWGSNGPYVPGDTPRIGFTLEVEWDSGIDMVNPIVASLLPPGFTYDGNFSIDGDAWTEGVAATGATYTVDIIDNFAGGDQQLVRMTFHNLTIPSTGVDKGMWFGFDMSLDPAVPYGWSQSEVYGSWESPADAAGISWRVTDTLDYDGDGVTVEQVGKDTEWWQIGDPGSGAASLDSVMWVKGSLDATWSQYPNSGLTIPSGQADYELHITNSGGVALKELTVIEILPHIGDHGVVDLSARNSEWEPLLVGSVAAPTNVDVFYSVEGNPCRDELTPGLPAGCDPPNWSLTPPTDITTVKSLKFAYQDGRWLMPGQQITFAWPMRAAINAPTSGEIAWSSFGVIATRADNDTMLLPSEPMKVGIGIQPPQPPFYGDTVWFDANRDGIQDVGESGVNGVRVELWADDGDGVADLAVDTMHSFTLTSNDGTDDGKYLFPYLPPGDYFSVFYMPADHSPSPADATSDDLDSDGVATTIGAQLVTVTAVTTINVNELDMTWDQGIYDRSALPAVWAIADLGAGAVVIGGKFQSSHGVPCGNIAVLGASGAPSLGFNSGSGFDGIVRSVAVTGDGKILVGGEFTEYDGHAANGLALINGDGSWYGAVAQPNTPDVRWVGVGGDGTLYAAGGFTSLGGQSAPCIGRLTSTGAFDSTFDVGAGADGPINCAALLGNEVLVGGGFSKYQDALAPGLALLNQDGSRNTSFNVGSGFDGTVNSITIKSGMIFAVGEFNTCGGHSVNGAARLDMSGVVDTTFGDSGLSVTSNRASN